MKSTKQRCDGIERKLNEERTKTRGRHAKLIAALSCAAAIILTLSLVLFLPYPVQNIAKYKDSEYYSLICKLDDMRPKREYKNFFGLLSSAMNNLFKGYGNSGDAMAPTVSDRYEETTNNQVQGVIEGDLLKRSDQNIYYLTCDGKNLSLDIYPIAGMATAKTASLKISPDKHMRFTGYETDRELYINQTAMQAFVITPSYHTKDNLLYTAVIAIDLTGEAPIETGRVYASGSYVSSRLVNGKLLLVSNFHINKFDFGDEKQYVPQTGAYGSLESVSAENVIVPEEAVGTRYTVLCTVDMNTLKITDSLSFLSYSEEVYVSENAIYTTFGFVKYLPVYSDEDDGLYYNDRQSYTKISRVEYSEELSLTATFEINGTITDRYGIDEHEGVLRVFTTTRPDLNNASLYCFALSDNALIAAVENFAPRGESVRGARFMGNKAYVCTAVELSDPVYAFDLSDYNNITCTDTGTITGYSLFLTPFQDGTMLGIGIGESRSSLKIEFYAEEGDKVVSLAKFEDNVGVGFSKEFKDYYVNAELGFIGMATENYYSGDIIYRVWQFDGYDLKLLKTFTLESCDGTEEERAVMIDGIFYLFCPSGLRLWSIE